MTSKFRTAALAALVLAGVFHLRTASAAPVFQNCEERAIGYGQGYCDASTGGNWSSGEISYYCNADGSIDVVGVTCN